MSRSKTLQSISPSQGLKIKKEISDNLLGRYQYMLLEQIYCWFEGYEKIAWKAITEMVRDRQLVLVPGEKNDLVKVSFFRGDIDEDRLRAFWALIKLKRIQEEKENLINIHIPHNPESCIKISFFIEGSDVETQILRIRQGSENKDSFEVCSMDPKIKDEKEKSFLPVRFVIIDSEEQIPYINIQNIMSFMKVDKDGNVKLVN